MLSKKIRAKARLRRMVPDERGGVIVEFAIGVPVLLLLLSGAIDLGLALDQSSSLRSAARAGAQYAMRFPSDSTGISSAVKNSVTFDPTTLTVASSAFCECPSGGTATCGDASTCSGQTPYTYVSVTVSMPYSSPLPTSMMIGVTTLSGSAVFRAN
jgi:Flp pilus assembly protein TadG